MSQTKKYQLFKLEQLESDINSGKTAYAYDVDNLNFMNFSGVRPLTLRLIAPGRYRYSYDFYEIHWSIMSTEDETHTLQSFIESIEWDESVPFEVDMRDYLSLCVWSLVDADPYAFDYGPKECFYCGKMVDDEMTLGRCAECWEEELRLAAERIADEDRRAAFDSLLSDIAINL